MTTRNRQGALAPLVIFLALAACGDEGVADYVAITSVTPDHGSQLGGNVVAIEGYGFASAGADVSNVIVGNDLAVDVRVVSDTRALITMPPATAAALVDIQIFNGNGRSTLEEVYSYNPQPTVTDATPGNGPQIGGTEVTLTGSGFSELEAGENVVDFDGRPAPVLSVVSDTELKVESPAGSPPKLQDIRVTNANGSGTYATAFAYQGSSNSLLTFSHGISPNNNPILDPAAGEMLYVDLDTLTVTTSIVAPGGELQGVSAAAFDGTNLFVKTIGRNIERIAPATGERTDLGPIGMESCTDAKLSSLVFHQGLSYAFCRRNQNTAHFGRFDMSTRVFTPIGTNNGQSQTHNNLASDGTDLYIIGRDNVEGEGNRIAIVNPATGTVGPSTPIALNSIRGATFLNGKLYVLNQAFAGGGSSTRVAYLYELDRNTGIHTQVMQLGSNLHGLTPSP